MPDMSHSTDHHNSSEQDMLFVRNEETKRSCVAYQLDKAFANAWAGFVTAFTTQRNMKIHVCVAVFVIVVGFAFKISVLEWVAITLCIAAVFAFECVNTALESVVDLVSPAYHTLAKRAKDCAAAAVLVAAMASVVVGALIILPRLFSALM